MININTEKLKIRSLENDYVTETCTITFLMIPSDNMKEISYGHDYYIAYNTKLFYKIKTINLIIKINTYTSICGEYCNASTTSIVKDIISMLPFIVKNFYNHKKKRKI